MQKLQDGSLPELSQKLGLSMDVPLKALTLKQLSGRKREWNGLLGSSSEFSPKTPHKDRLQLVLHIDLYALRLPERLETLSGVLLGVQQAKVMTVVCSREELAKRTLLRNRGFPGR